MKQKIKVQFLAALAVMVVFGGHAVAEAGFTSKRVQVTPTAAKIHKEYAKKYLEDGFDIGGTLALRTEYNGQHLRTKSILMLLKRDENGTIVASVQIIVKEWGKNWFNGIITGSVFLWEKGKGGGRVETFRIP